MKDHPAWQKLPQASEKEVSSLLEDLLATHQTPRHLSQAQSLIDILHRPHSTQPQTTSLVFSLLTKWVRHLALSPIPSNQLNTSHHNQILSLLHTSSQLASQTIVSSSSSLSSSSRSASLSAVVFLTHAAKYYHSNPPTQHHHHHRIIEITNTIGTYLLSYNNHKNEHTLITTREAAELIEGCIQLITLIASIKATNQEYDKIEASCWLLAALLDVFNTNNTTEVVVVMVDIVLPWYTSMKIFAQQQQGDMKLYQAVFDVLQCVLEQQEQYNSGEEEQGMMQRSAAVLGMCGFLDGLLTAHSLQLNLQQQRQGDVAVLVDKARAAVLSACRKADCVNSKRKFHDACALGTLYILHNQSVDSAFKHHFDELSSTMLINLHLSTLLETSLTLRNLPLVMRNNNNNNDADIIAPLLKQQLEGAVGRETASLARSVSRLYRLISRHFQPQHNRHNAYLLDRLVDTSRDDMHGMYTQFMLSFIFPPPSSQHEHHQLSKNDATSLRALLDRVFMSYMVILLTIWEEEGEEGKEKKKKNEMTGKGKERPSSLSSATSALSTQHHSADKYHIQVVSSKILLVLSNLQFCRMQLSQYNTLLEQTIKALTSASSSKEEEEEEEDVVSLYLVNNGLPCYSNLIQPYTSNNNNNNNRSSSIWIVDGVGAMRIQFMMIILSTLVSVVPQQVLLERLAPLSLLFVRHPHPSTSAAANNLLCAIVTVIHPREGDEIAQLLPFYLHQALQPSLLQQSSGGSSSGAIVGGGGVEGKPVQPHVVAQVLGMFVRCIPPTRLEVVLLCFERLISFGINLAISKEGEEEEEVNRGVALFAIAAALLAVVDIGVLEECAAIIERGVVVTISADNSDSGSMFVEKVLMVIYESIARSDDCVRKTVLVRWYQKLAAQVEERERQR